MSDTPSILDMLLTYIATDTTQVSDIYDSVIGINSNGEKVEYFVKDLLCDSLDKDSKEEKESEHRERLSWLGSQNHPPDIMLEGNEAIEVKKSRGKHTKLQLNSSTPKTHIKPDMKRINQDCAECEDWSHKDMVYVLASDVSGGSVGFMWVLYGDCWCSDNSEYEDIVNSIEESLEDSLSDDVTLDMSGNELGKVKDVGKGGSSELRIRPMWSIEHPASKFKDSITDYKTKIDEESPMFMVMKREKFFENMKELSQSEQNTILRSDDVKLTEVIEDGCEFITIQTP